MCELCNNNEPPHIPLRKVKNTKYEHIRAVSMDYTGQEPCKKALESIGVSLSRNERGGQESREKTIDDIIIDRLVDKYRIQDGLSRGKANFRVFNEKYKNRNYTREHVYRNIYKITNLDTGNVGYLANNRDSKKSKTFGSLEEAKCYISKAIVYPTEQEKKAKLMVRLALIDKKGVARNIIKVTNRRSGHIYFDVLVKIGFIRYRSSFDTITAAIEYRDHTKAKHGKTTT